MRLGTEYTAERHWIKIGIGVLAVVIPIVTHIGGGYAILALFTYVVMMAGGYQKTFSIVLEYDILVLTGVNLLARKVVSYNVEDIWLELIYSGSTGEPSDAMLNVFVGKKCVRQIHVKEGYKEAEFKELIRVFDERKAATTV